MKKGLFILIGSIFLVGKVFAQQPEFKVNGDLTGSINAIAYSPNGRYALSGSTTMQLWDINTGREIRSFNGHSDAITAVAFSLDGKFVISGSADKKVKVWDIITGADIYTFSPNVSDIKCIAISPDGKYLAIGGGDVFYGLYDFTNRNLIRKFYIQERYLPVTSLVFSSDGKYIASSSWDGFIKLCDVSTGKEIITCTQPIRYAGSVALKPDRVLSFSLSPNCKLGVSTEYCAETPIRVWDMTSGKLIGSLTGHSNVVESVQFSPDGKYVISGSFDKTIKLWDIETLKVIRTFDPQQGPVDEVTFSPDGKSVLSVSGNKMMLWDVTSGHEIRNFSKSLAIPKRVAISQDGSNAAFGSIIGSIIIWDLKTCRIKQAITIPQTKEAQNIRALEFSPDNRTILSGSPEGVRLWDVATGKLIRSFIGHGHNKISGQIVESARFSPDGKTILTGAWDGTMMYWEVETGKILYTFQGDEYPVNAVAFSPDGKYGLSGGKNIKLWELSTGTNVRFYENRSQPWSIDFSADGKFFVCEEYLDVKIYDVTSGNLIKSIQSCENLGSSVRSVRYSHNGKYIASGADDHFIRLFDAGTGTEIRKFVELSSGITSVAFSSNDQFLLSGSGDGTMRIWDVATGQWLLSMISNEEGSEWLAFSSDGYWDASQNGGELVTMVKGLEIWNIDQFAVKNNRPDLLLTKISAANPILISHFKNQHLKRLKKLNLVEGKSIMDYNVPVSKFKETVQNGKFLDVKISLSDNKEMLKSYNLFVNNVPLYGTYGKPIQGKQVDLSDRIELSNGQNKIELSCTNVKGVESYRELTYAFCSFTNKPNLYLLAFGVSKYKNSTYNLQFADKDALDLENVIQSFKSKGFENVYTKVLTNEQVTPDAIRAAKDIVKNAKPDDTFVLFIAGHGLHDTDPEATYYFLTSNADLKNLKGTAADFETIEDLLQGIPPRNKLFLMDACESGEIEEEEQGQMMATATGVGINSRGFKVLQATTSTGSVAGASPKRTYLFQKDRYIYNDLVRRSGAIVFSSSKGGELSYERSDIENGLFTEYIMKALTTSEADKDNNGFVSTDELRQYVSEQVAKASGDLQHPTVDRDNIYQKFGFQIK